MLLDRQKECGIFNTESTLGYEAYRLILEVSYWRTVMLENTSQEASIVYNNYIEDLCNAHSMQMSTSNSKDT